MAFEYLESSVVVISSVAIVVYVSVVGLVVDLSHVFIFWSFVVFFAPGGITGKTSLKVVPEGGVLIEGYGFELAIGVKTEDHDKEIVDKADDGVDVYVFFDACISAVKGICAILDRSEEIDQEGHCKEDAEEDEDHDALVTTLMLNHPDDQYEEKSKDCLREELRCCDKIENHNCELHNHYDFQDSFVGHPLLGRRYHFRTTTHLNIIALEEV